MPKNPTDARSGEDDLTDVTNVTDVNDAADAADDDSPLASDEAALRRARREASLARLAAVRARGGRHRHPEARVEDDSSAPTALLFLLSAALRRAG